MSAVTLHFCFSFPPLSLLGWGRSREQQLDSSLRPECCGVVDSCWHCFLPISAFQPSLDDACDDRPHRRFPPHEKAGRGFLKPTEVLFSNISPVYRKSVFISWTAGCLVCLHRFRLQERIYSSIFISPVRSAAYRAGFVSVVNQRCACSKFADSFKQ